MSFQCGESLVGEGAELAHIDLIKGSKDGPVGTAYANALARQSKGHSNLMAVLAPNLATKPDTVMVPKFTVEEGEHAAMTYGPCQAAVAKAVADKMAEGVLPKSDDICLVVCVFVHKKASDKKKVYDYNYQATCEAIDRASESEPSFETVVEKKDSAEHPFKDD